MNIENLSQPAYPIVPLQDNFGKLVVPVPGLSKLELFALEIFKAGYPGCPEDMETELMNHSYKTAKQFLTLLDENIKILQNEKSTPLAIIK